MDREVGCVHPVRTSRFRVRLISSLVVAGGLLLTDAAAAGTSLSLGLNTAAWNGQYTGTGVATINAFLTQAHIGVLRYPGGSWADEYDWSQNADFLGCFNPGATNPCPETDAIGFDTFAQDAAQAGATTFVTVNYGSGSPALAAAWVAHARTTPGEQVALWEVGNENYGCWEVNNPLAGFPAYVQGYKPNSSVCPDTQTMANSYAANALPFLLAMKNADPAARIGVPWALQPNQAAGAGVVNAAQWNDTVLGQDGSFVDFVDVHWYPFSDISGLTDTQIVTSISSIQQVMQGIRATLHQHHLDRADVVVGETNISNQPTPLAFQPVAALAAAGTTLGWLSAGALSVDWWDMNNFGSPQSGDFGMFTSSPAPGNAPLPAYYGYWLASLVTASGRVETLDVGNSSVFGFQSGGEGRRVVLLINADTTQSETVRLDGFRDGTLQISTYSAASAALANPIVQGTTSGRQVRGGIPLPPESITVLVGSE